MTVKAANGLVRILKAEGVPWLSTFPACCVNDAAGEEGLPIVMMREERFAVGLADAFSRVTGGKKIGVCTVMGSINCAGLEMAYGAVAQAFEDSSPLLCITDGVPLGASGATHYDMTAGFKAITKWIGHIDQPHRVPEIMRRAFTHLRSGRPGPVLVTIPRKLGEYDEQEYPYSPVKGWKWAPDPVDVKAAVKALLAAKDPLLYVGEGVFYADATAELLQFAELAQVPVLTTLKGKSAFPENHPLSVGVRGDLAERSLRSCDLLFAIGSSLNPNRFSHAIPDAKNKTIVMCTVDTLDVNRNYAVDYAVVGDAKLALQALSEELASQTGGGVRRKTGLIDELRAAKEQSLAKYRPLMEANDKPINPYRVYGDLMKVLDPNNSFVSGDSGNTRDQTSTVYESVIPRGYLGWGNVSTLGFCMAGAAAAKLAYPQRQCICITGDAGIAYMIGDFEALVRHQIGITVIYINNGAFGGYGPGFWGKGHNPYTYAVSSHAVADYSAAAKGLGLHAEDVTEPAEVIPALNRALAQNAQDRPALLEIICSQYPVYGGWVPGPFAGR